MRVTAAPKPTPPLLTKRARDALLAVAANPGGLRYTAHPSVMPVLLERGLVRIREGRKPAWLLTDAGRRVVREVGLDDT